VAQGNHHLLYASSTSQGILPSENIGKIVTFIEQPRSWDELQKTFPLTEELENQLLSLFAADLLEISDLSPVLLNLCRRLRIFPSGLSGRQWNAGARIEAPESFEGALQSALRSVPLILGTKPAIVTLAASDYLDGRIAERARMLRAEGTALCLARLDAPEIWIGPLLTPTGACYDCFARHHRESRWLTTQLHNPGLPSPPPSASLSTAAIWLLEEVARWLLDAPGNLDGLLWSFDWATRDSKRHEILRNPYCSVCGTPERSRAQLVQPVRVRWDEHGGRSVPAETVVTRLERVSSPVTGIVSQMLPGTGEGSFAWDAIHYPALPPSASLSSLLVPGTASGCGESAIEAKAACLAEVVERYSSQYRGDEDCVESSLRALGDRAVSPESVSLYSEHQYKMSPQLTRLRADTTIHWLKGICLNDQAPSYVPLSLAISNYLQPGGSLNLGELGSNGCAAAATPEEAMFYGLMEVVERDSVGMWWYSGSVPPALDLSDAKGPGIRSLLRPMIQAGWRITCHDLTSDLAVPVALAIAVRPDGMWTMASAAHVEWPCALSRALTELSQMKLGRWRSSPAPASQGVATRSPDTEGKLGVEIDLGAMLQDCVERIKAAGHLTYAFNLSRAELNFPVYRMVVPGLRSLKPRFAPGRLYEVPKKLGWGPRFALEIHMPQREP
jgi:oxazoline/thiazoline synthase